MGDLRPQSHGVDAGGRRRHLDRRLGTGGHLQGGSHEVQALRQLLAAGRAGQARGSGVRNRRRIGTEADHQHDPEATAAVDDLGGEGTPLVVRLGPVEEQHVPALHVVQKAHLDAGPLQATRHPVHEAEGRPSGTVVQQAVRVEAGDGMTTARQEVRHGVGSGPSGVDPSVQGDHQHRRLQVGAFHLDEQALLAHRSLLTGDGPRTRRRCRPAPAPGRRTVGPASDRPRPSPRPRSGRTRPP